MKILLVNQFDPASGAPTGRILGELATELERNGHTTLLLTLGSSYGKARKGWARRFQELFSHVSLIFRGWTGPRPDVVISLTSPACLIMTAGTIARFHRARHVHWAMDLYPDLALQLGELRDGPVARFLHRRIGIAYCGAARVVTLDEDMRQHLLETYATESEIIPPFPRAVVWPEDWTTNHIPGRWLYSGNFGRAYEIDVLLQVQKLLEFRG